MHIVCANCETTNRIAEESPMQVANCGRCKQALFSGQVYALNGDQFNKHFDADLPLLVDFWAPWCQPCLQMAPEFSKAASALEPKIRLIKINNDEQRELAGKHGIRGLPTLILFHHQEEIARQSGAMQSEQIIQWVKQQI